MFASGWSKSYGRLSGSRRAFTGTNISFSKSSRAVLLDEADAEFAGHLVTDFARIIARQLPALVEAFKNGERPSQLSWAPEGRPDVNKAVFLGALVKEWLCRFRR